MKKYTRIIAFFIIVIVLCQCNISFAACELNMDSTLIEMDGIYTISGSFRCEKISLIDYALDCSGGETDIYWWNGTEWDTSIPMGCQCSMNSECSSRFCFEEICNDKMELAYPDISFKEHSISIPQDTYAKNIIEINNTLNKDDVFYVVIEKENTADAELIWAFSHIEGKEGYENDKYGEFEIKANSTKRIMLVTTGISENTNGDLIVIITSALTGLSSQDSANYAITPSNSEYFFSSKPTPDISALFFILIGLFGAGISRNNSPN